MKLLVCIAALCSSLIVPVSGTRVWELVGSKQPDKKQKVKINHGMIVSTLAQVAAKGSVDLEFEVEGEELKCTLGPAGVMAPGLAAKFPDIQALMGPCDDGADAIVTIDTATKGSFKATIWDKNGHLFYADHETVEDDNVFDEDLDILSLVRKNDLQGKPANWTDEVLPPEEDTRSLSESTVPNKKQRLLRGPKKGGGQSSLDAYKFRFVAVTTPAYSAYHGNTTSSVLAAIVSTMTRVNGIYLRELGVMFELIDKQDQAICLNDGTLCGYSEPLSNSASTFIYQIEPFLSANGIASNQYDLGHGFGQSGGGIAQLAVLCGGGKARGVTGIRNPKGDVFDVDYVSHEIGHQMSARHSYRDCSGSSAGNTWGIEAGSGSSVMSYAGICGSKYNIQRNADSHFNALQVVS